MKVVRVTGKMGIGGGAMDLEPGVGLVALLGNGRALQAAQALVLQTVVGLGGHRRRLVRDARVQVALPGKGEVLDLVPGDEAQPLRRRLQKEMGLDGESLALVWAGGAPDLGTAMTRGARLLARKAGLERVEQVLDALSEIPAGAAFLAARERANAGEVDAGAWEPASVRASRLARLERDLRELRADAAMVQGDLEEATMDWTRERQDAETTLMAYRDRARELKLRLRQMEASGPRTPCPTCGQVLDDHYDTVAALFREEWESVVQDGQWWKRRREQLELKPGRLQELENRSLRRQASIQEAAERAGHLRTELGVDAKVEGRSGDPLPPAVSPALIAEVTRLDDPARAAATLTALARDVMAVARTSLLSETSKVMNRLSGGRLVGLDTPDGAQGPVIPHPVSGVPGREDFAAARVAAHLALARSLSKMGLRMESLLVGAPFGVMDEEDQIRAVAILRRMTGRFPQILVLPSSGVVDASPEMFDAVWEFTPAPERGLPAFRPLPVGVGSVRVGKSVGS